MAAAASRTPGTSRSPSSSDARALDTLVTQNVDGLHHLAGNSPEKIVEIHGNRARGEVHRRAGGTARWRRPSIACAPARTTRSACDCGGILKSATISFGENLVPADLRRAQLAAAGADLFLAIGTSLVVYPVAGLPELALQNGAALVILNAEETPYDRYAVAVLRDRLEEVLPVIVDAVLTVRDHFGNT